jgi:Na+-transporting NADH:ubiquinone oxidoreductase subunit NqrC
MRNQSTTSVLFIIVLMLVCGFVGLKPAMAQSSQQDRGGQIVNQRDIASQSRLDTCASRSDALSAVDCPEGTRSCGDSCCGPKEACCSRADGSHFCGGDRCPDASSSVFRAQPSNLAIKKLIASLLAEH